MTHYIRFLLSCQTFCEFSRRHSTKSDKYSQSTLYCFRKQPCSFDYSDILFKKINNISSAPWIRRRPLRPDRDGSCNSADCARTSSHPISWFSLCFSYAYLYESMRASARGYSRFTSAAREKIFSEHLTRHAAPCYDNDTGGNQHSGRQRK